MRKPAVPAITYMRGLCMLGVIGIHVGSYALSNPHINIHLLGLLEIVSRFTVPAFFFLSAFGLLYHTPIEDSFSYKDFLRRRIQVVLYPYIVWTILYTVYNASVAHSAWGLMPHVLGLSLLFGNSMYHLYFLVILLWFYALMPLWRWVLRHIVKAPIVSMSVLFFIQMGLNYYSSYMMGGLHLQQEWLQYIVNMRLNYFVGFYIWIFLLGGLLAERFDAMMEWIDAHGFGITIGFIVSLVAMLGSYYYVMAEWGYTRLEAIYTVHQLSPQGLVYTAMGCIFFVWAFTVSSMSDVVETFWAELGDASYGIYLVHPFVLIAFDKVLQIVGLGYTAMTVIVMYISAVILSFGVTKLLGTLPKQIRGYVLGK